MNRRRLPKRLPKIALLTVLAGAIAALAITVMPTQTQLVNPVGGDEVQQTLSLQAGWNAVYLQVDPQDPAPAAVFAGLPVESVWTPNQRLAPPQFVSEVTEPVLTRAGWLMWVPSSSAAASQINLYGIQGNQAYLIKLTGAATWTVQGQASARKIEWLPDDFTLTGLSVDPNMPVTFGNWFAGSAAHKTTAGALQPVYTLDGSGQWTLATASTNLADGKAYWIYTQGGSDYQAPVEVEVPGLNGLVFGTARTDAALRFRNRTSSARTIRVRQFTPTGSPVVLEYWTFDTAGGADPNNPGGVRWLGLPASHTVSLPASETVTLRLSPRRASFAAASVASVLEITDGQGMRRLVPVSAQQSLTLGQQNFAANQTSLRGRLANLFGSGSPSRFGGLWAGTVQITHVSNPVDPDGNPATPHDPQQPQPVGSALQMRLLLHVDRDGNARLLKQAIQMWQDGEQDPNEGVTRPGEFVLLTDDDLIAGFKGSTLKDGKAVGRRTSAVLYDFDDTPGQPKNSLLLSGNVADNGQGSITGAIVLKRDRPTNPFRHGYHPDHDNLDARYRALPTPLTTGTPRPDVSEVYEVRRTLTLTFEANDPLSANGTNPPAWGSTLLGGTFDETVQGLHRDRIYVRGKFRLERVSNADVLNPTPVP